jgi:putative membrane protein
MMRHMGAPGSDEKPRKRYPHYVYDVGDEPDPRFSLANERTFLAWVRTALATVAGAVALHALATPANDGLRTTIVVILLVLAAGCTVLAFLRWAQIERTMRLRAPLPGFSMGWVLTIAIVLVAVLLAVAFLV